MDTRIKWDKLLKAFPSKTMIGSHLDDILYKFCADDTVSSLTVPDLNANSRKWMHVRARWLDLKSETVEPQLEVRLYKSDKFDWTRLRPVNKTMNRQLPHTLDNRPEENLVDSVTSIRPAGISDFTWHELQNRWFNKAFVGIQGEDVYCVFHRRILFRLRPPRNHNHSKWMQRACETMDEDSGFFESRECRQCKCVGIDGIGKKCASCSQHVSPDYGRTCYKDDCNTFMCVTCIRETIRKRGETNGIYANDYVYGQCSAIYCDLCDVFACSDHLSMRGSDYFQDHGGMYLAISICHVCQAKYENDFTHTESMSFYGIDDMDVWTSLVDTIRTRRYRSIKSTT